MPEVFVAIAHNKKKIGILLRLAAFVVAVGSLARSGNDAAETDNAYKNPGQIVTD